MARAPILPRSAQDPTGIDRVERGAIKAFERKLRQILAGYQKSIENFPSRLVVNARYVFELDAGVLEATLQRLDTLVDAILLGTSASSNWFFEAYVAVAYQRGTSQAYTNLSTQSPAYAGGRQDLGTLLRSAPYQRRLGVISARVFESMKGLSGQVKADMSRVLTDGLGRGLNPREIARNLAEQTKIENSRARRIARTEVPTALRRARWDERDAAAEDYALNTKLMHISALSPTTRVTHARRHGRLFTSEEVRDWYAVDANSINCKCSQVEVMVDDNGKPLVPAIVDRARQNYRVMKSRSDAPWAEE